ncbi:hypothetical protein ACIPJK_20835 [Streptomyces roseus]|uniref:hypothetical protein n=1 Tax=Streptomyces roseus TaxID=66430 RepID=UPI0037F2C877
MEPGGLWAWFRQATKRAASRAEKLDMFVRFYLPRHQGDERYALWTQVLAQRHDEAGRPLVHFAEVDLPEFTILAVAMLGGLSEDVMFGRSRQQDTSARAFACPPSNATASDRSGTTTAGAAEHRRHRRGRRAGLFAGHVQVRP